jgi:hypothetical protein
MCWAVDERARMMGNAFFPLITRDLERLQQRFGGVFGMWATDDEGNDVLVTVGRLKSYVPDPIPWAECDEGQEENQRTRSQDRGA